MIAHLKASALSTTLACQGNARIRARLIVANPLPPPPSLSLQGNARMRARLMGDPASSAAAAGLSVSSPLHRLLGEYPAASADAGPTSGRPQLQNQRLAQQQHTGMPKVSVQLWALRGCSSSSTPACQR